MGGAHVDFPPSREVPGAPSQLPSDAYPLLYPRELNKRGIREIQACWVAAARRAQRAGFDIVYVYGAHGYLPMQFLSPFYNKRTDEYGGSLPNRARFWLETLELVRDATGDDCAIAARIGIDDTRTRGIDVDEALEFVALADALVDLWDVNMSTIAEGWIDMRPSRLDRAGYQVPTTSRIREATAKPIVGVSRLTDPDQMADIVRTGGWDVIGAARPSIADPFLPRKINEGRVDEIRECIGCNVCISRVLGGFGVACTQNPTAGEEYRRGWTPERFTRARNADRDVLVVGAGAAGLECAMTLAKRGMRRVHLVEAGADIGGYVATAARLPGLGEWARVVDYRRAQLARLKNVEVITGVRLEASEVREYGAEIVVLATGARWRQDGITHLSHEPLPGASAPHVLTPERVMLGDAPLGGEIVVFDCEGYFMGVGLAQLLAERKPRPHVHLVTPLAVAGPYLDKTLEGYPVRQRLAELGVEVHVETEVAAIGDADCVVRRYERERLLHADTVILATARQSNDALYGELTGAPQALAAAGIEHVFAIGDCVAPRLIADCIFDGHRLAREIDEEDPSRALPFLRERPAHAHIVADCPTG